MEVNLEKLKTKNIVCQIFYFMVYFFLFMNQFNNQYKIMHSTFSTYLQSACQIWKMSSQNYSCSKILRTWGVVPFNFSQKNPAAGNVILWQIQCAEG